MRVAEHQQQQLAARKLVKLVFHLWYCHLYRAILSHECPFDLTHQITWLGLGRITLFKDSRKFSWQRYLDPFSILKDRNFATHGAKLHTRYIMFRKLVEAFFWLKTKRLIFPITQNFRSLSYSEIPSYLKINVPFLIFLKCQGGKLSSDELLTNS